jgi:hypothetical protein
VGEFKGENPRSPSSSHKAMSTYSAGLGSSTASRCSVSVVEAGIESERTMAKKRASNPGKHHPDQVSCLNLNCKMKKRPELVTCVRGLSSPYTCIFMIWNLKPINTCSWLWYRSTCYSRVWWHTYLLWMQGVSSNSPSSNSPCAYYVQVISMVGLCNGVVSPNDILLLSNYRNMGKECRQF